MEEKRRLCARFTGYWLDSLHGDDEDDETHLLVRTARRGVASRVGAMATWCGSVGVFSSVCSQRKGEGSGEEEMVVAQEKEEGARVSRALGRGLKGKEEVRWLARGGPLRPRHMCEEEEDDNRRKGRTPSSRKKWAEMVG
jgi:hypothetical protein